MILYHFFGSDRGYDIISSKKGYVQCLILYTFYCCFDIKFPTFFKGKGIFREKSSIPANTGIIPAPVLNFQYRIGNTSSNLSLRNTIFRQAENDFSEQPEKVIEPKSTDFQKRLLNPDDIILLRPP
jgi:hypothetical protein